jgi:hypothetical protein
MGHREPKPIFQLTTDSKHPAGSALANVNCNPAACATLIDLVTCGRKRPSAAAVRELCKEPNGKMDKTGGTHNSEVAAAMWAGWRVKLYVDNGTWKDVVHALMDGCGVSLAGSAVATHGTKYQARAGFSDNHQWAITDIRQRNGKWEVRVFDPLADGKERVKAPFWMPTPLAAKFAASLDLRSQADRQAHKPVEPLGRNKANYGKTDPIRCDDRAATPPAHRVAAVPVGGADGRVMVVKVDVGRVRKGPSTRTAIVARKVRGQHFLVGQRIEGQKVGGSRVWFGDDSGHRWMHSSLLKDA